MKVPARNPALAIAAAAIVQPETLPMHFERSVGSMLLMLSLDLFLVAVLLTIGFFVVNLGLLSKRREDLGGKASPGDLRVLTSVMWPESSPQRQRPPEAETNSEEKPRPKRRAGR
ncbi:MAG: hypothetical protein RJB38_32 [Pseudomonadota bacterium]